MLILPNTAFATFAPCVFTLGIPFCVSERFSFSSLLIGPFSLPLSARLFFSLVSSESLYPNLVHAPEFLTAANAVSDYVNGSFAIIGGSTTAYRNEAERIIRLSQPNLNSINHCSISEASFAKYTINSFLATKVIFMNEMAQLAEDNQCNWNNIKQAVGQDKRLGASHMQVPGPDGEFGFGGMCFPKDTSALLKYAESTGQNLNVLDVAVKKNLILRLTGNN